MNVIKRDGSVVQYDRSKIVIALTKANDAVEEHEKATHEQIDAIADFITNKQNRYYGKDNFDSKSERRSRQNNYGYES